MKAPFFRRKFFKISAIVIVILGALAVAAYDFILGHSSNRQIAENVHLVQFRNLFDQIGANSIVIEADDRLALIDTQLPLQARRLKNLLQADFGKSVAYAVNTHWHPDHSGGNASFTDGAVIIAHKNVSAVLSRPHLGIALTGPGSRHEFKAVPAEALPTESYGGRRALDQSAVNIELVHYPNAHTDGDTVLFINDGAVVAMGDIVWPGGFPFIDTHSGGSYQGVLAAIDDVISRIGADALIVPGHGDPINKQALMQYRAMVENTTAAIRSQMSAGLSLEEIQSAGLADDKTFSWQGGFVTEPEWIRMVYESSLPQS